MGPYRALAEYYDRLTADVPYGAFADYYERIFRENGLSIHSVLDVGCGTGTLTYLLQERGYDMIGADASGDMLIAALDKPCVGERPLFLHQSMEDLDLYGTVDAAVCSLDGVNYVEPRALTAAFSRIRLFLEPGGIFIFDVNTPEKLRSLDGEVFLDETEDLLCVWRAEFDEEKDACFYGIDLFSREDDLWRRESEEHVEYAYGTELLREKLKEAGFVDICVYGELSLDAPSEMEQRIFITARKPEVM